MSRQNAETSRASEVLFWFMKARGEANIKILGRPEEHPICMTGNILAIQDRAKFKISRHFLCIK